MVRIESSVGAIGLDVISPSQEQLILMEASLQNVPLAKYARTKEERIVAAQVILIICYVPKFKSISVRFIWFMY